MEYTKLGRSDLNVSRLCLGCMGFGQKENTQHSSWTLSEDRSRELIKLALNSGINFFDTAIAYSEGVSEQVVGRALRDMAKRDEVVVATKFLPRTQSEKDAGIDGVAHVRNNLEQSLKNLGMDYVDLYICHMWDYHTPMEEVLEGMGQVVKEGKARYIGFSNCYAWQLQKANYILRDKGYAPIVSMQGHYNMIFREEEREMFPYCADAGIALTPYSPLASGRLVKDPSEHSARLDSDKMAMSKYDRTHDQDAVIITRVAEIAQKRGLTKTQVVMGWLLTKVTSPVIGATKERHITEAVAGVGVQLSPEEIAYLEEPYVPHKLVGVMEFNHA